MNTRSKIYWIHTLTPLHVGAGRGVGFVDLPIVREKTTNWPIVPGSAVKGVWRDHYTQLGTQASMLDGAFGKESKDDGDALSGALVLTDARIVLLPIRSFYGTFAYATSALALTRLSRDLETAGFSSLSQIPNNLKDEVWVAGGSALVSNGRTYLEDLDFQAKETSEADAWATFLANQIFDGEWQDIFKKRFMILPDNSFDFLCETGTEVNARVRIDDNKKIVAKGALWYEESLPTETILAGVAWCDRVFGNKGVTPEDVLTTFCDASVSCQIGGKATIGKGQVRCHFTGSEA